MAIIYSYPSVASLQTTDLFIISRVPTDPDEISNFSVTADALATFVTSRVNLNFQGGVGTGVVNLDTQSLNVIGTTNEIETTANAQTLQIGLPDNVTITNNLTVGGNNLLIEGLPNDPTLEFSAANYDDAYIQTGAYTAMKVNMQDGVYRMMGDLAGGGARSSIYPIRGNMGENVSLWYLNNIRFQTTNTGIDVFGDFEVSGAARIPLMLQTVDMQNNGIINLSNPVNPQDAVTKSYVDTAVTGLLEFKGTFRADTGEILSGANAGSYLYNCPGGAGTRVAVDTGDYYIVANTGGNFYCSGDLLNVGDSIIAVADAAADSSTVNDWATLEGDNIEGSGTANKIPLWTDSQVLGDSVILQDGATANSAVSIGVGNTISNQSYSIGGSNTSSSVNSVAIGFQNTVDTKNQNLAVGSNNIVSGGNSQAVGSQNTVLFTLGVPGQGSASSLIGAQNSSDGARVFMLGSANTSSTGSNDVVLVGRQNTAADGRGYAFGDTNVVAAFRAFAIGATNTNASESSILVGTNNSSDGGIYQHVLGRNNNIVYNVGDATFPSNVVLAGNNNTTQWSNSYHFGKGITSGAINQVLIGHSPAISTESLSYVAIGVGRNASRPLTAMSFKSSPGQASTAVAQIFAEALYNAASYADDAAAAAGGIELGQLYRTGSIVKIRMT